MGWSSACSTLRANSAPEISEPSSAFKLMGEPGQDRELASRGRRFDMSAFADFVQMSAIVDLRICQRSLTLAVVDLLRAHSSRPTEDVSTFLDALVFNWLIAGTDAHAKNYSLLLGSRGQVRLAPLYDLGSALPYPELDQRRLKLAMKLGSTYKVAFVAPSDFRKLAAQSGLEESWLIERARTTAAKLLAALPAVFDQARQDGLGHPSMARLALGIEAHARRCSVSLTA